MKPDSAEMAYVARAACGCIRAATVDVPEIKADIAKDIGEWVMAGYTVEHVSVDAARKGLVFGICPHEAVQEQLL